MHTKLHPTFADSTRARAARDVIANCVHCGFCNATCPTYLELGDERDGPRGRIYLIRQMLESGEVSEHSRRHLDRCLTCRACETTCPSGVEYGRLADFGREVMERRVSRTPLERMQRRALRLIVPHRRRFGALLRVGQWLREVLPQRLRAKVPERQKRTPAFAGTHHRRVALLDGCVQSAATPNTNDAATRVLSRLGITALRVPAVGCCGALSYHLSAHEEALDFVRRNIDALLPLIEAGVERVVSSASGCGVMLKDYGALLAGDPDYADAARRVSEMTVDLCELLAQEDVSRLAVADGESVALHCPCTLNHGLGLGATLRSVLQRSGVRLASTRDDHLCCGSAGTYSLLQPELSHRLLANKLDALAVGGPERIATANVGCQLHLASKSGVPVGHWIELLDR